MLEQVAAQDAGDRHGASASLALWRDLSFGIVPAALHMDLVAPEIDVLIAQRAELAAAQPAQERNCPQRTVSLRQGLDEREGLGHGRHSLASAAERGKRKTARRVAADALLVERSPVDRPAQGLRRCAPSSPTGP